MNPLLEAAVRASIVLLIGLGVRAMLRHRSPSLRHAVLAAAIVAAPLVALAGWIGPGVPVPARLASVSMVTRSPASGSAASALPAPTVAPFMDASEVMATDAPAATTDWSAVGVAVWAAGAAIGCCWLLVAAARLRRLAAASAIVDDPRWCRALDRARVRAGVARPVRLLAAPHGLLLATWGWRRPRILMPAAALTWSDARMRTVLAHEIAHVARHDWLLQSVAEVMRALLWWNPLAWLACRALRHDSEFACDDAVLRAGVGPTDYAEDLLQIARIVAPAAWPAVMAMRMARTSTLERRIVAS